MPRFTPYGGARRVLAALALLVATAVPSVAHAHFFLDEPPNWVMQDSQGMPQKTGPCGSEMNPTKTNVVTPYMPGDTVTIKLHETVGHPGHFIVTLATDMASLKDPPESVCDAYTIQDPPVYPVLADGKLVHTAQLNGMQTFDVTLPTDVTCTNCALQVMQYMDNDKTACFYHHCAMISISGPGAGGMSGGAGAPSGGAPSSGGMGQGGMMTMGGGMSGSMGQAGTMFGFGGMPGASGGTGSGGFFAMGGSGGSSGSMIASAGMPTSPTGGQPGSTAGRPGTGGAGTGGSTGGMTMAAAGSPTGTPLGTDPPAEDPGCGCRVPARQSSLPLGIASVLALGLALARRRRR